MPPIQLRFSGMFPSEGIAALARRQAHRIAREFGSVVDWEVTFLRLPSSAAPSLSCYGVRVHASLPDRGLAGASSSGPDLVAVLREAFEAVEGELSIESLDCGKH